jgi:hypothetical protein
MSAGQIIQHAVIGLLVMAAGIVSLKYNYQIEGFVGHIDFVERYLGSGSTYLFLKLLGIILFLGGVLYATGLLGPVVFFFLRPVLQALHIVNS